jgi:hypothetical protein
MFAKLAMTYVLVCAMLNSFCSDGEAVLIIDLEGNIQVSIFSI